MRWASWRGAFLSLMSGAALNRVNPTLCAKPKSAFTAATWVLIVAALAGEPSSDAHGLERGLDVIDGRVAQICPGGCERRDEAPADPFVGPECVGRAVGVRLEPDGDEVRVRLCRRVQRRQPFGVGSQDLRPGRGDDFEFGACRRFSLLDNK